MLNLTREKTISTKFKRNIERKKIIDFITWNIETLAQRHVHTRCTYYVIIQPNLVNSSIYFNSKSSPRTFSKISNFLLFCIISYLYYLYSTYWMTWTIWSVSLTSSWPSPIILYHDIIAHCSGVVRFKRILNFIESKIIYVLNT